MGNIHRLKNILLLLIPNLMKPLLTLYKMEAIYCSILTDLMGRELCRYSYHLKMKTAAGTNRSIFVKNFFRILFAVTGGPLFLPAVSICSFRASEIMILLNRNQRNTLSKWKNYLVCLFQGKVRCIGLILEFWKS